MLGMAVVGGALVALAAGCGGVDEGDGADAPRSSPTASTSTPPATPVDWVDGLPVGPPPDLGYVIGHTYHSADGRTVALPRDRGFTSIVRLGDGYLATSDQWFEGSTGVYLLDRDGRIDESAGEPGHVPGAATVSSFPVLSADRATVHWLTFTPPESGLERPTLLHAGDVATGEVTTVELDHPPTFLTSVAGVVDGLTVVRDGWGGQSRAWVSSGGPDLQRAPALDGVTVISPRSGLVALRLGEEHAEGGVVDFATRDILWRRAGADPIAFSPSGRRLLVFGGNRMQVADARTGEVRADVEPPAYHRAHWSSEQLAWEDETHLLAGVALQHRAAVVRIDVESGDVELAIDWTPTRGSYYVAFETRN